MGKTLIKSNITVLTAVAWLVIGYVSDSGPRESGPDVIGKKILFLYPHYFEKTDLCHMKAEKSDLGRICL